MENLKDYIVIFKEAVTHPLCDALLTEFSDEDEWVDTVIGHHGNVNKKIRNASTIAISFPHVIGKNQNMREKLDKYLFASAAEVIQKYNDMFPYARIEEDSGYELLRYKEGQFYTQHTDSFKSRPRSVSCSFALNDNYEGGEFAFFKRKLKYKLEKGDAILFPSNFMYPHEIMPVISGTRYSIVTWFI